VDALEELARDQPGVQPLLVYIREAHAEDEWCMEENTHEGVCFPQPRTLPERRAAAQAMISALEIEMPVAVDDLDDAVAIPWGAWPERLYVIDARGRIAWQGGQGPMDFEPAHAREFLERHMEALSATR
jgi:hypothetical protein